MDVYYYIVGDSIAQEGELALKLREHELIQAMEHPSIEIGVLRELMDKVGDSEYTELRNKQYGYLAELFEEEAYNIHKQGTNTPGNPKIQPNFYLHNVHRVLAKRLKHADEKDKAIVIHKVDYDPMASAEDPVTFERKIGNSICSIFSVDINSADSGTKHYSGDIWWADLIEDTGKIKSRWEAHPTPKGVNMGEQPHIRPKNINSLTGRYDFTLLDQFNKDMAGYIRMAITTFEDMYVTGIDQNNLSSRQILTNYVAIPA